MLDPLQRRQEQLGGGCAIQQQARGAMAWGLEDVHWGPRVLIPQLAWLAWGLSLRKTTASGPTHAWLTPHAGPGVVPPRSPVSVRGTRRLPLGQEAGLHQEDWGCFLGVELPTPYTEGSGPRTFLQMSTQVFLIHALPSGSRESRDLV